MADRFYAEMYIPQRCMTAELESLIADTADPWDGQREEDGLVAFCDDQAYYGEFPDIESYCVEHRIPFDRYSTGAYEYDPEWRAFRPDLDLDEVVMTTEERHPTINAQPIRNALDEHDDPELAVKEIRMYLDEYAPMIPPLK